MSDVASFSTFSVEFQITQRNEEWVFGHFYFLIDGQVCGDPEDLVALNCVFNWVKPFLEHRIEINDNALLNVSDRELINKLYDPYMVINISGLDFEPNLTGESPHSVSYLGMSAFDSWMILLVELSSCQRIVWASFKDKRIFGARLPMFKIQKELTSAFQRYQAEV